MSEKRTKEGIQGLASRDPDFSKLQSSPTKALTGPFEDAYLTYMKATQALYDEFQKRCQELYREYVQALQEAWSSLDAQQRSEQAYHNYCQALKKAWESSAIQSRLDHAYQDYVGALQAGWAAIDPATLGVHSLGAIGYSIVSACWYAYRTVGRPLEGESPRS